MTVIDLWTVPLDTPQSAPARRPSSGRRWEIEVVSDAERFASLGERWNGIVQSSISDCFFLTWEWLYTWWRHLGAGRDLALLAVRHGDRLAGVAPFTRGCCLPAGTVGRLALPDSLQVLGTGPVGSDYLDLIVRAGEERGVVRTLADHLDREGVPMELRQLPGDGSLTLPLVRELERRGWRTVAERTNECPVIDLAGLDWEGYVASLGSSHRQNLRRRLRKLDRAFDVSFGRVETEAELDEAFDIMLALHRDRWDDRGGSDAFPGPAVVAFHRELTRLALRRGWLRLYVLRLDGRPAAALYGFLYRGRFLFYQSGFDRAFADHSVGLVTMGLAIREAISEGAREFDLLHGDEPYKFLWANRTRPLIRLELYPPSVVASALRGLRGTVRGAKRRLRSWRHAAAGGRS